MIRSVFVQNQICINMTKETEVKQRLIFQLQYTIYFVHLSIFITKSTLLTILKKKKESL